MILQNAIFINMTQRVHLGCGDMIFYYVKLKIVTKGGRWVIIG